MMYEMNLVLVLVPCEVAYTEVTPWNRLRTARIRFRGAESSDYVTEAMR